MRGPERGAAMHTVQGFGLFVKDVSGPSMFAAHLLSAVLSRVVIRLISNE
jgi:hypothetical protein